MSHSNANFRNDSNSGLINLRGNANGNISVDVPGLNQSLPPFLTLACGTTTEGDLLATGLRSFFRTNDLVANQAYYARECNLQLDTPTPIEISVTSQDFEPYAVLTRDLSHKWPSHDGVIVLDVTNDITGPFVLEVTSTNKFETGHFQVHVTCSATINYAFLRAYWYFGHTAQQSMTQADFLAALQQLRAAVNAYDMTTLDPQSGNVASYDGATFTLLPAFKQTGLTYAWNNVGCCFHCAAFYLFGGAFQGNEYYAICERGTQDLANPVITPATFPPWTVETRYSWGLSFLQYPILALPMPYDTNYGEIGNLAITGAPLYESLESTVTWDTLNNLIIPADFDPEIFVYRTGGVDVDPNGGTLPNNPKALRTTLSGFNV